MEKDKVYERGLALRRKVLGDAYVDRAMNNAGEFEADFQELVVKHIWGTIWGRPNLSHRDRSVVNIAMIAALGRTNQLEAHILGALNNGLSREELKEILIQVSAYCGMPAGVESFRVAKKVLEQLDAQSGGNVDK